MTSQELDAQLAAATPIVRAAGALALDYFRNRATLAIEHKGQQDLVSIADRNVEEVLRERLAVAFPATRCSARKAGRRRGPRTWVLDPIDGTFNFLKGIPCWGVVAALVVDGRIEIGLTYDPVHDEMFTARRGGAFATARRSASRAIRASTPRAWPWPTASASSGSPTSPWWTRPCTRASSIAAAARPRSSSAGSPTAAATRSSPNSARPGTASPA